MGLPIELVIVPDIGADAAQALDNIGDVDTDSDKVENQGGAVEEEVRLAGAEELDEETQEADGDDNVEHATDKGRGLVNELQVGFEVAKEVVGDRRLSPQEGKVVGEGREKDTEEEAYG